MPALAALRGDKTAPALARTQPGKDWNASIREEAELLAASSDVLWSEIGATERYLLRQTIAQLARRPVAWRSLDPSVARCVALARHSVACRN